MHNDLSGQIISRTIDKFRTEFISQVEKPKTRQRTVRTYVGDKCRRRSVGSKDRP